MHLKFYIFGCLQQSLLYCGFLPVRKFDCGSDICSSDILVLFYPIDEIREYVHHFFVMILLHDHAHQSNQFIGNLTLKYVFNKFDFLFFVNLGMVHESGQIRVLVQRLYGGCHIIQYFVQMILLQSQLK